MPAAQPSQIRSIEDLRGPAGRLQALLNTGSDDARFTALICHPHPAGGGTMHNKVVYHAMRVFSSLGLPVLRFNFRSTGLSEGIHDGGVGEQDDVSAALNWLTSEFRRPILFAGFSFGAYVGLRACCGDPRVHGLIALGLPIAAEGRTYDYTFLPECAASKLFISGDHDQFAPAAALNAVWHTTTPPSHTALIADADHFFQGTPNSPIPKLTLMQKEMQLWLRRTFALG